MGNPFLFADRFSGAVVHLTTGSCQTTFTTFYLAIFQYPERQNARDSKLTQAF
jgi:hypothetical protein